MPSCNIHPGKWFATNEALLQHIRDTNDGWRAHFYCDVCYQTFGTEKGKRRHERHFGHRNGQGCESCQEWFDDQVSYTQHIKTTHDIRRSLAPAQQNDLDTQEPAVAKSTSSTVRNVTPDDGAQTQGEVNTYTESNQKPVSAETGQTPLFANGQDITPDAGNGHSSGVYIKERDLGGISNSLGSATQHSNSRWIFGGISEILNESLDVQKPSSPADMNPTEPKENPKDQGGPIPNVQSISETGTKGHDLTPVLDRSPSLHSSAATSSSPRSSSVAFTVSTPNSEVEPTSENVYSRTNEVRLGDSTECMHSSLSPSAASLRSYKALEEDFSYAASVDVAFASPSARSDRACVGDISGSEKQGVPIHRSSSNLEDHISILAQHNGSEPRDLIDFSEEEHWWESDDKIACKAGTPSSIPPNVSNSQNGNDGGEMVSHSLSPVDPRVFCESNETDARSPGCELNEADDESPAFSPRSFVRSAGCSPPSGRPGPPILPDMDSSPIFDSNDLPLPLLPDIPPLESPQCSRTSSNQAIASPSAASLAEAALQRSEFSSTVASRSLAYHDSLIKLERPEFGDDPQSPWSPEFLRPPLRPLKLSQRLAHETTSARKRASSFGSQESILPRPVSRGGSGGTRALTSMSRALALESKVPPSRYFASRPPTRLDQIQRLAPERSSSRLSQGTSTTSRCGAGVHPALRNQDEWNISEPGNGSLKPTLRMHCRRRGCCADPCIEPTAAMCGHIFCNICITRAVVETSACPLCANPTLLYCLFRLRLEE